MQLLAISVSGPIKLKRTKSKRPMLYASWNPRLSVTSTQDMFDWKMTSVSLEVDISSSGRNLQQNLTATTTYNFIYLHLKEKKQQKAKSTTINQSINQSINPFIQGYNQRKTERRTNTDRQTDPQTRCLSLRVAIWQSRINIHRSV